MRKRSEKRTIKKEAEEEEGKEKKKAESEERETKEETAETISMTLLFHSHELSEIQSRPIEYSVQKCNERVKKERPSETRA